MEPDFYLLYQDLPVPELVRVAKTPSDYLPEAVRAAQRILHERGITKEEIAAEEWVIAQKEMSDGLRRNSRRDVLTVLGEFFGSDRLTHPSERWFTILLLLYGIYYTFNIYIVIRQMAWLSRCPDCMPNPGPFVAWNFAFALYITLCLYCILKQRWLGWSLLQVHVVYFFFTKFAFLFRVYAHHRILFNVAGTLILPALFFAGFAVILWRSYVMSTFSVDAKIRSRTMLVAVVVGVAGCLVL